ncbi:hypothetical protein GWI33_017704 [Rhynchophorus ferrugineus]|uniref:Uncharacterized protein n=1 Tax=Rhynchophorus ferrugineus TaxID=354439 RepID=A0A834M3H5_RHYFE|nr:hypothetical protein GWI33_017704 [Rhynchophorus ferrugineus]
MENSIEHFKNALPNRIVEIDRPISRNISYKSRPKRTTTERETERPPPPPSPEKSDKISWAYLFYWGSSQSDGIQQHNIKSAAAR